MVDHQKYLKKSSCAYCGDAHVNHVFLYITGLISNIMDPSLSWLGRHTPRFLSRIAEGILHLMLQIMLLLRLAKFSDDIEKACSLRSKIVWEEAKKRGIHPEQLLILGKPTEHMRAKIEGKFFYYDSLPIPNKFVDSNNTDWDDKYILKTRFENAGIPIPRFAEIPIFSKNKIKKLFEKFEKPLIVKPALGSRGRHTTTNIADFESFNKAITVGRTISPFLVVEEHLHGYVCRATLVGGKLAGFYRAEPPVVIGDGKKNIAELILERDATRPDRVSKIEMTQEISEHMRRQGFDLNHVLEHGQKIALTHRTGRLFGGRTREMYNELHPSFVPILEKAAKLTKLPILGFDCIVIDPEKPQDTQRWGIIECNTLPFIDLHYFALEGKPQNIAGMIWDLWKK
jgi:cyanophycin synthetase